MENTIYVLYYRLVFESKWLYHKTYRTEGRAKNALSNLLWYVCDDRKEIERKRYKIVPYDIRHLALKAYSV